MAPSFPPPPPGFYYITNADGSPRAMLPIPDSRRAATNALRTVIGARSEAAAPAPKKRQRDDDDDDDDDDKPKSGKKHRRGGKNKGKKNAAPADADKMDIDESPAAASAAEGCRLYIGNLAYAATEDGLKEFFEGYQIEGVTIPKNPRKERPVGYAFVNLSTPTEAQRAIAELSGKEILERKVSVQLARAPKAGAAKGAKDEAKAAEETLAVASNIALPEPGSDEEI